MAAIPRKDFVIAYAARSGLSDKYAGLGFIVINGETLIALPCACGEDDCEGWAMMSSASVLGHLELYAPEPLRTAYREAVKGTAE